MTQPPVTLRDLMLDWIRARVRAGETQGAIAERLGMNRGQVTQLLSNYVPNGSTRARSFLVEHVDRAAASLGMTTGDFLAALWRRAVEIETEERVRGTSSRSAVRRPPSRRKP